MEQNAAESLELAATVKKVIFHSEDSGFTVFEAYPTDAENKKRNPFVAVGNVGTLTSKDDLILRGNWELNEKYNSYQFKIAEFELPDFKAGGIRNFVCNHLHGIGESLGQKIYDEFGEDLEQVMEEDPERLLQIKGIGKKKLPAIINSWNEHSGKRQVLSAFSGLKIGPATIQKILKRWENPRDAVRILNEEPYTLTEVRGIGFLKADEIARAKGFDIKHPQRILAAIVHALDMSSQKEGHCFLYKQDLFARVNLLMNPHLKDTREAEFIIPADRRLIEDNLSTLIFKNKVIEEGEGRVYLARVHKAERQLERNILGMISQPVNDPGKSLDLAKYEREQRITLHSQQREAVLEPQKRNLHIVTGGPGTGKTTIIKAMLATLGNKIKSIRLAAPTGRAAKRMEESTGQPATTIHRLLEFSPQNGGFKFCKEAPLDADLVIIDEASMLDVFLARALTDAIKPGGRLILIGDRDQLPSVGAGTVLADMLANSAIPRTCLTQIFRQSENSYISINAQGMLSGDIRNMNLSNQTDDCFWMSIDDKSDKDTPAQTRGFLIQEKIWNAAKRLLDLGYSAFDIQVLSPTYTGPVGVNALNEMLQTLLNPEVERYEIGRKNNKPALFSIGDRVMQLRNNYDKNIFNGDQGVIKGILPDDQIVSVEFDTGVIEFEYKDMDELTLAYCITVHKSQGSESPAIIIPITTGHYMMLQKNLVYTAITRAKKMCVLAGEKRALNMAVNSGRRNKRNTFLLKGFQAA